MVRLIPALFVLFFGSWISPVAAQQPVEVPRDMIGIADLGLENRIPSAIDLIGSEDGAAGRNRASLIHRLQCWIDGDESCSTAGRNDPRVREIRRFLTQGPSDRDGAVIIDSPHQTPIEVRLERVTDMDPNDWQQRVYEPVVLLDTAKAP